MTSKHMDRNTARHAHGNTAHRGNLPSVLSPLCPKSLSLPCFSLSLCVSLLYTYSYVSFFFSLSLSTFVFVCSLMHSSAHINWVSSTGNMWPFTQSGWPHMPMHICLKHGTNRSFQLQSATHMAMHMCFKHGIDKGVAHGYMTKLASQRPLIAWGGSRAGCQCTYASNRALNRLLQTKAKWPHIWVTKALE